MSGPCNPQQRSYHAFFEVLAAGSWLEVVPAGGHMQFAKVTNSIIGHALDWLCHSGHTSHEVSTCSAIAGNCDVSADAAQHCLHMFARVN